MKIKQLIKRFLPNGIVYNYYSLIRNSYAQAGQDFWVYGEVNNKMKGGYFVEVGSNDGITYNNTFLLESRFKWKGLCIEANPDIYIELEKNRRAVCINACISDSENEVVFNKEGLDGGIIFDMANSDKANLSSNFVSLQTYTLEKLFIKYNVPFVVDYLSMDIEGAEWYALRNFPFDKYRFNSMTIERPDTNLRNLLQENNYIVIKEIPGLDVFYIHKSCIHSYQVNLMNFWEINKKGKLVSL